MKWQFFKPRIEMQTPITDVTFLNQLISTVRQRAQMSDLQLVTDLRKQLDADNVDLNGLIVQTDKDGGDTAQRVACWAFCTDALGVPHLGEDLLRNYYTQCQPLPGRFVRHSVGAGNNNINNFTRDQSEILQLALQVYNRNRMLNDIFTQRIKRVLFHFNTQDTNTLNKLPDPPSLMEIAAWLRHYLGVYSYPLLMLLDVELIAGVIIRKYSKRARWDSDAKLIPYIVYTDNKLPTPFSKLAKYLYKLQCNDIKSALFSYFGVPPSPYNGVPALGKLLWLTYKRCIMGWQ